MRALIAIALAGCAYEDTRPVAHAEEITASVSYTIHGDTACAPNVRADTETSCRDWGTVSRGHIAFRVVWDLTASTLLQYSEAPLIVCRQMPYPYCGSTSGTVVEIGTNPRCNTHATALHELGHLAGIHDIDAPDAVMNVNSITTRLTAADVRACAAIGLCPRPGRPDVTTVTVEIDPAIPRVEPDYPRTP